MIKNKQQLQEAMTNGLNLVRMRRIPFTKWELTDGTKVNERSAWSLIKAKIIKDIGNSDDNRDTYYTLTLSVTAVAD